MNEKRYNVYSGDECIASSMTLKMVFCFIEGYSNHTTVTSPLDLRIMEEITQCCCKLDESYDSLLNSIVGD